MNQETPESSLVVPDSQGRSQCSGLFHAGRVFHNSLDSSPIKSKMERPSSSADYSSCLDPLSGL